MWRRRRVWRRRRRSGENRALRGVHHNIAVARQRQGLGGIHCGAALQLRDGGAQAGRLVGVQAGNPGAAAGRRAFSGASDIAEAGC